MTGLYPEIEPYDHGMFDVGDGNLFRHNAWLEDGILLRNAGALTGIAGVMVQGRLDLGGPLVTAWELAQAWPDGELVVVSGAGHAPGDPGMREAVIAATDRFATRD